MPDGDDRWMREALAVAARGLAVGELPIGAVAVLDGHVIAAAHTEERTQGRLLVHAELLALDAADRRARRAHGPTRVGSRGRSRASAASARR